MEGHLQSSIVLGKGYVDKSEPETIALQDKGTIIMSVTSEGFELGIDVDGRSGNANYLVFRKRHFNFVDGAETDIAYKKLYSSKDNKNKLKPVIKTMFMAFDKFKLTGWVTPKVKNDNITFNKSIIACSEFQCNASVFYSQNVLELKTKEATFTECIFDNTSFYYAGVLPRLHIYSSHFKGSVNLPPYDFLRLSNIKIDTLSSFYLTDTCVLSDITGKGTLELISSNEVAEIILQDIDINRLKLPTNNVHITVDPVLDDNTKVKIYSQLINYYSDYKEFKQEFDIALQKLIYHKEGNFITPTIRENWNNFGYDNTLIFRNSIVLMALFLGINWLFYANLLCNGYNIEEFVIAKNSVDAKYTNVWVREFFYFIHCFIYTLFIFWGLKLGLDKLKITHIPFTALILIQYLTGIVCLAYIANIIITK